MGEMIEMRCYLAEQKEILSCENCYCNEACQVWELVNREGERVSATHDKDLV